MAVANRSGEDRRWLTLEKPLEATAMTCFVLCHLVYCVVDCVISEFLGAFCNGKLALAGSALSLGTLLKVSLGIPNNLSEKLSKLCSVLRLLKCISLK